MPTRTCLTGAMEDKDLDAEIDRLSREWRLDQIELNRKENELRRLRRERDRRRSEQLDLYEGST